MSYSPIKIPIVLALCFIQICAIGQRLSWQLVMEEDTQCVTVANIHNSALHHPDSLRVFVGKHNDLAKLEQPAILGEVRQQAKTLSFQPSFSFRPGVSYTAFLGSQHHFIFDIPQLGTAPSVSAIYPSGKTVPANLLKIYLHFTAPMGEGHAYENLCLTNAKGDTIYQPFVPLQPELWSEDRRRLTLWLDPGRVKRGLLSHETHGVVIEQNQKYTLSVHPTWTDIHGNPLAAAFKKEFSVVAPDYRQPNISSWKIIPPKVGSMEPLIVEFTKALDHALASRHLSLKQEMNSLVAGQISLPAGETQWHFHPEQPWGAGQYTISIHPNLEDLAGNNLLRPFDRDLNSSTEEKVADNQEFVVRFEIRSTN